MMLLSVIGLFTSFYLVQSHYENSPGKFCDFNKILACSVVNNSGFSEILNVPVAAFGMIWFLFFLGMVWQARRNQEYPLLWVVAWCALGMLSVIYFIIAEIIIGAICMYCTIVHIIIVSLLILALLLYKNQRHKPSKKVVLKTAKKWLWILIVISFILIVIFNLTPPPNHDQLANCLTEKGFAVYSSIYCGHCIEQKELFGDSFQYIKVVECHLNAPSSQTELCLEKNVTGTPTWIQEVDGEEIKRQAGFMSISELKQFSECE